MRIICSRQEILIAQVLLTFSSLKALRKSILGFFSRVEKVFILVTSTFLYWKRPIGITACFVFIVSGCTVKAVGDPNRPITINAHITLDIKGLKDSASNIEDFVSGEKSKEDLQKSGGSKP